MPAKGYPGTVNDQELHDQIEALVSEEHALFDNASAMTDDERRRLGTINVQLDRLWDLLRQRRAREEFGQDPATSSERSPDTVEHYQQ